MTASRNEGMVVPETSITIVDEEFIKLQRIFICKLFFLSSHFRAHRLSATSKLNFSVYIFVRWRGSIALLCLYLLYVVFWLHDFLSRFSATSDFFVRLNMLTALDWNHLADYEHKHLMTLMLFIWALTAKKMCMYWLPFFYMFVVYLSFSIPETSSFSSGCFPL